MSDVKDILGVCKAPTAADPGKSKSSEKKPTRPEWMSREAFALLDTTHPIVPSALSVNKGPKGIREKPKASARGKITWQWQAFRNPARQDGLELMHWVKCFKDVSGRIRAAEEGEYPFAKFNKKPAMVMYTDEEYNSLLAVSDAKWSRAETDYLMGLCEQFDLRWPVIADRFHFDGGPPRTMEELKSRYYSLARLLLIARNGEDNVANLEVVRNPYNFAHEVDRKRQLALAWARSTGMENPEDARVLEEAAAIEARQAEVAQAPPPSAGAADPEQKAAAASADSPPSSPHRGCRSS
uniref:DNA methyltransferase 1-associated protein 1 n=1 Tax=Tetraselmis sp. GSL018 TaxID=582737 RepID=A0A061QNN8_9CHLO